MRKLLSILLFAVAQSASAQPISDNIMSALKTDDSAALSKFITPENINVCYEVRDSSYTLLALTIKANATQSFKMILDEQADFEKVCASKTPLMYTAKYGTLNMAEALVKVGADHNFKNSRGRTATDYAKKYKQKKIYIYLKTLK